MLLKTRPRCLVLLAVALVAPWIASVDTAAADTARGPVPGLTAPDVRWRIDGIELERSVAAAASIGFSPDGRHVVISSPSSIRVLDAADGSTLEQVRAEKTQRLSYSLAIANTGRVSVGRPGSRHVHEVGDALPIVIFPCHAPGCIPVSLAFSPDDAVLAFHEIAPRPATRTTLGSVVVVDLVFGDPTRMAASRGLARTAFATPRTSAGLTDAGTGTIDEGAFELWQTQDQQLPRSVLGRAWTVGRVPRESSSRPEGMVAIYGSGSTLVMRNFEGDRLAWAAPLVPPALAPAGSDAALCRVAHVELSPDGRFVVSYEIPVTTDRDVAAAGAIVLRDARNGTVIESYDVSGVADLAIAPDSASFVYATATSRQDIALVAIPRWE